MSEDKKSKKEKTMDPKKAALERSKKRRGGNKAGSLAARINFGGKNK